MSNMKYFGKIFWSIYSSPKFSTQMLQLFIIKICFTNKFNTTCGGGQLLVSGCQESMCHRISVLSVLVSWFWVSGSQVPSPRVSVLRSRVSKSHVPGSDNLGPGSQVLIVDYAFVNDLTKNILIFAIPWLRKVKICFLRIQKFNLFPCQRVNREFLTRVGGKYFFSYFQCASQKD